MDDSKVERIMMVIGLNGFGYLELWEWRSGWGDGGVNMYMNKWARKEGDLEHCGSMSQNRLPDTKSQPIGIFQINNKLQGLLPIDKHPKSIKNWNYGRNSK